MITTTELLVGMGCAYLLGLGVGVLAMAVLHRRYVVRKADEIRDLIKR